MQNFNARLFGPAQPAAGLAVTARFEHGHLVAEQAGLRLDAAALVVSVGGLERPELRLNWLDPDRRPCSLAPAGEADRVTLCASAPPALQAHCAQWQARGDHVRQTWMWLGAAGALLLLVALALGWALWQGAPRLTEALARRLPLSFEQKLGQAMLIQLRARASLIDSGPAQAALHHIGGRLTAGSPYSYRWIIQRDPSLNAYAIPGGIVVVHSGLLRATANGGELAAVLAHEVQHIERRHALRHMIGNLGLAAVLALTVGDVSAVAAALAHQLGSTYFSRELEQEADRLGFQALLRAGVSPVGMPAFFRTLQQRAREAGQAGEGPAWLASHPLTAERIGQADAMLAAQPCPACRPIALDWQAVLASVPADAK
ncbi:MAG: M48 family metallopeptidase [Pseudomonadota bacterium]